MTTDETILTPEETPAEEVVVTPEETPAEPTSIDTAQELAALLTEPMAEETPASQPEAAPQPEAAAQPEAPAQAPKKIRKKPHILIRIPLQLLSLVLAIALFATTLAGALVLDVQALTSAGGMKQLINTAMSVLTSAPAEVPQHRPTVAPLSSPVIRFDTVSTNTSTIPDSWTVTIDDKGNVVVKDQDGNVVEGNFKIDENGKVVLDGVLGGDVDLDDFINGGTDFDDIISGGDVDLDDFINGDTDLDDFINGDNVPDIGLDDIPEDILMGGNGADALGGLIDWIYDQVADAAGEELPISKEQLQDFVADSTVGDYLGEKLAGFADDYINGTNNTVISADDLLGLLEENEEALKEHLDIELSPEIKEELHATLDQLVEESGINEIIREEVFSAVDEMIEESTASIGMDMEQIRGILQILTSDTMRWIVIGVNAALLLLLCLLNFYNVPAALTWASFPCMFSGAILSAPLYLMETMTFEGEVAGIVSVISSFANIFKPIHFGVLYIGVGLLVVSIAWRIIRSSLQKAK